MGVYDTDGRIRLTASPGSGFVGLYAPGGSWYYTISPGSGFVGLYAPDGSLYVTHAEGSTTIGLYAEDGSLRITTGNDNNGASKVSGIYDPTSEAIFTAFTTPPTDARKVLVNNLVTSLKTAQIWDDLDLLYLLAAADDQAARINWKNPGVKTLANVGAGPSFVADQGFTGNGTTTALNTAWTPSTDAVKYTLNDASLWTWCRSTGQTGTGIIGNVSTNPVANLQPRNTSNIAAVRVNNAQASSLLLGSITSALGMFGGQRLNASALRMWKDGVLVAPGTAASTGLPTSPQWIAGNHSAGFDNRQVAMAAWGASLSGKELAFYNAVNTYMQAVGAA